jgi:hypothetical protein
MEWVERVSRHSIDMYDQGEPDVCIIEVKKFLFFDCYCNILLTNIYFILIARRNYR